MDNIKVISFDLEGTLVTPNFSQAVWHEGIPSLYANQKGISFVEAKAIVLREYQAVGDQRKEWYDIKYWFSHFGLGDYRQVASILPAPPPSQLL
jgi:FMN phosphatase YigB (HAD superfamily)